MTATSDFLEAAGLNSYDPAEITRIYAGHPLRLLKRLRETLIPIGLLLLGVLFDRLSGRPDLQTEHRQGISAGITGGTTGTSQTLA